ncbi:MAG TPA: GMC oxidoreductase, partial [Stellaceae bacterium]|nr:GMC oxidoreductase [Stellaceae bacterium]
RVHGAPNLFVASSAVFPTSSQANPTLTIAALSARLAAHLARLVRDLPEPPARPKTGERATGEAAIRRSFTSPSQSSPLTMVE